MPLPITGLARVTIRAPRCRLDLAVADQVPLAELLPEVLRRCDGAGHDPDATRVVGGWVLRRGDGTSLDGGAALAAQGVRDGDVLYLVPQHLAWPEPAYDDVVEEVAASARARSRPWDAIATRLLCLGSAGLILLTGLVLLAGAGGALPAVVATLVATALIGTGGLLSRAGGDGVAGTATAGLALPYATAAGILAAPPAGSVGAGQLLVGAAALLLASVAGAIAVGCGLRVFAAGVTVAGCGGLGALLGLALPGPGAASIVVLALVAGVGLGPMLSVRLGRLPLPVVTSDPEIIAAETRPDRASVQASVARADEILTGTLLGVSISAVGCVAVLAGLGPLPGAGTAGALLAGLGSLALALRARVFPTVAQRLPMLVAGMIGLAVTATVTLSPAGPAARLAGLGLGVATVVGLLTAAITAGRRPGSGSPYPGRVADIIDIVAVLALAPVAFAVLDLYSWARGLAS